MTLLANQISPPGLQAPGLAHRDYPPSIVGTNPIVITTTPTQVTISTVTGAYVEGGRKGAPFTAEVGTQYEVFSGCTFNLPTTALQAEKVKLSLFNPAALYGIDPTPNKINNSTSPLFLNGGQTFEITFDATLGDWE